MKLQLTARSFSFMLVGLLALVLGGGTYGYYWAQGKLVARNAEYNQLQLQLVNEQKHTDQLLQLSRRYNEAKGRLDDINQALPRASQQAEVLLIVQEAASQTGVKLPSIAFTGSPQLANPQLNQATKTGDLYVVPISLKLSATYAQLNDFLKRLENLSRYNSVGSLSLSKTAANASVLDVSLTLNAYFKP